MRSLFRHPSPEQETDEPPVANEETVDSCVADVPEGLISSGDLPSAAETLEDLFREEAPVETPESIVVEPPKPTIRELLLEEDPATEAAAADQLFRDTANEGDCAAASEGPIDSIAPHPQAAVDSAPTGSAESHSDPEAVDSQSEVVDAVAVESEKSVETLDEALASDSIFLEPAPAEPTALVTASTETVAPAEINIQSEAKVEAISEAATELNEARQTDAGIAATADDTITPSDEGLQVQTIRPFSDEGLQAQTLRTSSNEGLQVQTLRPGEDEAASVSSPSSESSDVAAVAPIVPLSPSEWALEERLGSHKEWVDSRGQSGTKATLPGAELEGAELIGVNLRHADMQDSNLKGADLLLADLRDACLVRANLQESCLVGANLEGANLEGATLDTAMGLVPRQLAGANLHEASLPEQIAGFEARSEFVRISQMAARFFTATMAISGVSSLIIWKTKDVQLLANSSILPFLHSATAAAALPTAQMYLIAPVVLFIVYLVFHFHLQNLWDAVLQLPGIFPDGRELGQDGPRIVTGLLRAHFRWMNRDAASTRTVERAVAFLLAYWVGPVTLLLFWARYLTLQDMHGTMLHLLLVVVASGVALYATLKVGRPPERWSLETKRHWDWISKIREANPLTMSAIFGAVLLLLAIGTIDGAPHDASRAPQFGQRNIRRWAPTIFWSLGYDPYADLTEAALSTRPPNWSGADEQVSSVKGAQLGNVNFRYSQAYGVFLANAHLWRSDFQGAFLSGADFRSADLGQATLRYALMDGARLYHANIDRGNLDGANLDRVDFREANLSHCSLVQAILVDAQLQGASLYGARLSGSSMERANLEKTDLRSAYLDNVNLEHADLRQTYLWSAKLHSADLRSAQLGSAIFIDADLQDTDLRGAQFTGTVLNGTNFSGANIDGTDLRGALGLTPAQVCSTKSRSGAILADSLAVQVQVACGGPLLAAPSVESGASTPADARAAAKKTSP